MRMVAVVLALTIAPGGCSSGGDGAGRPNASPRFGFGRAATADEITAWDIDVMPDGTGLPAGSGTPSQGAAIYARRCAACHGRTGTEGPFDRLVGRDPSAVKTIGNYWPYATTLYDYLKRAMPLDAPGSLDSDAVYALVAFLLWRNDIIASTDVIDAHTLPRVVMPARDRFVPDNRRGGAEIR